MAIDKDDKIKIRAFYECNNLSGAKVSEHFKELGIDVSAKTIEKWARVEGWERKKYADIESSIEALLPSDILEKMGAKVKEQIIEGFKNDINGTKKELIEPEVIEEMAKEVTKELIWKTLSRESLLGKMGKNLQRAEAIANTSTSIGTIATYHGMLVATVNTVYGKRVDLRPVNPNAEIIDDKELESKSSEELLEMLNRGEDGE